MEILPVYDKIKMPERLKRQNKIQNILNDLEYSTFRINKNKKRLLGLKEIKNIGVHSNLNDCEYLFVPKIKLDQFKTIANNETAFHL